METCPFDVPRFNEDLGVVEKCTLCADRIANKSPVLGNFLPVVGSATQGADFQNQASSDFETLYGDPRSGLGGNLEPACVETCPTDALKWGPLHDIVNQAQKRAEQIGGFTYGIEEAGGTNVVYVLQKSPQELGLPNVYKERISARTERLFTNTFGLGAVAGLLVLFGVAFKWVVDRKNKLLGEKNK